MKCLKGLKGIFKINYRIRTQEKLVLKRGCKKGLTRLGCPLLFPGAHGRI